MPVERSRARLRGERILGIELATRTLVTHRLPLLSHPIAYTLALGGDRASQKRGYVRCERREETVSTDVCAHCPRFVKVMLEQGEGGEAVVCQPGTSMKPSEPGDPPLSLPRLAVADLMTRNVVCVRPELNLEAAAALFSETGLKAAPVVDAEGKLLGFVSEADVLLGIHRAGSPRAEPELPRLIAEVMLAYPLALPETASLTCAAAVMAFEAQHRVAIVSRAGAVVGVLSASDVLYWLAQSDGHVLPRPGLR